MYYTVFSIVKNKMFTIFFVKHLKIQPKQYNTLGGVFPIHIIWMFIFNSHKLYNRTGKFNRN